MLVTDSASLAECNEPIIAMRAFRSSTAVVSRNWITQLASWPIVPPMNSCIPGTK